MPRKHARTDEAEINITPMLDIVFIMLIFFIVTTSFTKETGAAITKPIAEQAQRDAEEVMQSLLSGAYDHSLVETGEELLYVRPGLRPSAARKLRRGQYAIEAELDLHGQRVPEAHALINDFLRTARLEGKRCLKIIHGKGLSSDAKLPVLKGKVDSWLRRKGEVLAYCSARPDDGGTGAVYVLLKRK